MTTAEKLTTIAENEQKVFDAGKQAEYDAFWDLYQSNGTRRDYGCAFAGTGWKNSNFLPRFNITPTNAYMMFRGTLISGDLVEILAGMGLTLDFGQSTNMQYTFMGGNLTRIGVIDCTSAGALSCLFQNNATLHTVDVLVLREDGINTFTNAFSNATALENITIEGSIGNNLDIHWSPLSHDSLMSIINHLQTKTSGSFVLTLGTDNLAKLTDAEKAIATERGWTLA